MARQQKNTTSGEMETERLRLTPLMMSDADDLHAIWTTPEVREYLWDHRVLTLAETREIVQRSQKLFAGQECGLWTIRQRGDAALLGFCGLWPFEQDPLPELLFGLSSSQWGKGIAFEASSAILDHAFQVLGWEYVPSSADPGNQRSHRLLARLGFSRCECDHAESGAIAYSLNNPAMAHAETA
ncbi:hypothetical protein DEA8626_01442 [Defluviimonas aquaemixtae]|uniref:N-acetyltransferase domain-containing protein n=1 Tax=Albidovulum aquaemixtae TaxID=1542388 RepID=A0A2R8B5P4_9RHOB|nr:GNAT family N-acetyltransferase [Defluviimonas aquaemixtae]SPH17914.1 hypothetical protein DEA8626_01442 [Defluviimonas aquaemixtae]